MITSKIEAWRPARAGWIAALLVSLAATTAGAAVLLEEALDQAAEPGRAAARWEALAVSSARSAIAGQPGALAVRLAPGDQASFSRAADLRPTPDAVLCRFNFAASWDGAETHAQVLRMGWDFGTSNQDEADARTYAKLGVVVDGSGFRLRDLVGGRSSAAFRGTQAVTWAVNNSGEARTYAAPNGKPESVGNDRMDVWIGRDKVLDEIVALNPAGRITDLKWFWSQGSGSTRFDRFELRTLDDLVAYDGAATDGAAEAALDPGVAGGEGIALYRPTPNPFSAAMRYAYAIPGGSAAVDIGVFDLAGRRVRELARGQQSAGQYEVRWDGLGDDGKRVKHGIFFLRASIAGTTRVSRVVYLRD
jgi:hypothetical protein